MASAPDMSQNNLRIIALQVKVADRDNTIERQAARIAELEAENAELREALKFYENPTGDVPDFYSELDFGGRARAALGDSDDN